MSSTTRDRGGGPQIIRDPLSRRGFLTGAGLALGAGSAAFLAACGAGEGGGGSKPDRELAILEHALSLELTAIAAYRRVAEALRGEALQISDAFLMQEQEHADALTKAIKQRGGTGSAAGPLHLDHPRFRGRRAALAFASDLENVLIAAYVAAVPMLSASDLRAIVGEIVAVEAEHLAVISGELGRPQAPGAFVGGDPEALAQAGLKDGAIR